MEDYILFLITVQLLVIVLGLYFFSNRALKQANEALEEARRHQIQAKYILKQAEFVYKVAETLIKSTKQED